MTLRDGRAGYSGGVPSWADTETMKWLLIAGGIFLLLCVWPVVKFVQALVAKVLVVALLVALAVAFWLQRTALADCAQTCECSVFGIEVEIPAQVREQHPSCA